VKCITNDIMVPADAEMILEGYFDERGHVEPEGPYGEFLGYYGALKRNPVFHLTAITRRKDALFQTATIGGKYLARTDTAQLCALRTEVMIWRALEGAVREPLGVCATTSSPTSRWTGRWRRASSPTATSSWWTPCARCRSTPRWSTAASAPRPAST
jgi:UbiD family decarboxylase